MRIAMIAITTKSSISVKPARCGFLEKPFRIESSPRKQYWKQKPIWTEMVRNERRQIDSINSRVFNTLGTHEPEEGCSIPAI